MRATHFDSRGRVKMVDVGLKQPSRRVAVSRGRVVMSHVAFQALKQGKIEKGEAIAVAKAAGILAAKRTAELIPLCHPIPVDCIKIDFRFLGGGRSVEIESEVRTTDKTGVEMEALTAVAIASLTLYDMVKALDRSIVIEGIRLIKKAGGKSGTYVWDGKEKRS